MQSYISTTLLLNKLALTIQEHTKLSINHL